MSADQSPAPAGRVAETAPVGPPAHGTDFVEALLEVAAGSGGNLVLVHGELPEDRRAPYWSGVRHRPVETLFEAVLRPLAGGSYEQIVAFTGATSGSEPHLPGWSIPLNTDRGGSIPLGSESLIWNVRGTGVKKVERGESRHYTDRLADFLKYRNELVGQATAQGRRTLLLVDFWFIAPTHQDHERLLQVPFEGKLKTRILHELPQRLLEKSPVDMVFFAEHRAASGLARLDRTVLADVVRAHVQRDGAIPELAPLPRLFLGPAVRTVIARRGDDCLPDALVTEPDGARRDDALASRLRSVSLTTRRAPPTPPRHPEFVALRLWANLDLAPLKQAFDAEMFGQEEAKRTILDALGKFSERCRAALDRAGRGEPSVRPKDAHDTYKLPSFFLVGAAGMGKTEFKRVLKREIFGDERLVLDVDLSEKRVATETVGVAPPYEGSRTQTRLMSFARANRGFGLVFLDELTRVMAVDHTRTLAEELSPLYQILEDRCMDPASPFFSGLGTIHMANTIFILAGNVLEREKGGPSSPAAASFRWMDELGAPLLGRITYKIRFHYLSEAEVPRGVRWMAERQLAEKHPPEAFQGKPPGAFIDEALVDGLVRRMKAELGGAEPAMRHVVTAVNSIEQALRTWQAPARLGPEVLEAT
jgi:hypothetical protein